VVGVMYQLPISIDSWFATVIHFGSSSSAAYIVDDMHRSACGFFGLVGHVFTVSLLSVHTVYTIHSYMPCPYAAMYVLV